MQNCGNIECLELVEKKKYCSLKCRNYYVNKYIRDYTKIKNTFADKRKKSIEEYNLKPKNCICCNNKIEFESKNNKFCSLSCSAKYTNKGKIKSEETKKKLSNSFYTSEKVKESLKNRKKKQYTSYCKSCNNTYCGERARKIKIKMIDYMGNECKECHIHVNNSHPAIFDFHHLDPTKKDFGLSDKSYKKWEDVKIELDKCILLCSNCHRILHAKQN